MQTTSATSDSQLGPRDVRVWILRAPENAGVEQARRCEAILSPDELARMKRFRFETDRRRYLFAHALVRHTLSRYAPHTPPAGWRFETNGYGRPHIAGTAAPPLRFNLSHTAGLVACVVALDRDVGVDVEHMRPARGDFGLEIAPQYFAPGEVTALSAQPVANQRDWFFAFWTLKEAYIKARGVGLALPLAGFTFDLRDAAVAAPTVAAPTVAASTVAASPDITITFASSVVDEPARWYFERRLPSPEHALALAVRRAPDEALAVTVEEAPADFPTSP
jgi:4'-phosphopantetheinyl transferase